MTVGGEKTTNRHKTHELSTRATIYRSSPPKITKKKTQKECFWGSAQKSPKIPERSQNTQIWTFRRIFYFLGPGDSCKWSVGSQTEAFFWWPLRDNRPSHKPGPVLGTNQDPSQGQTGPNRDFSVELNRKWPVCPRKGFRLSQGWFLFVPNTVPTKMFMFIVFSCLITVSADIVA